MKKTVFFKKDEKQVQETKTLEEIMPIKECSQNVVRNNEKGIIDKKIIKYIIDNFPSMSIEIRNALSSLSTTLENTIDYIEDKSSELIKNDRDFKLSQAHRDTSIDIYKIVQDIEEYSEWMKNEYEKNIQSENIISKKKDKVEEENINKDSKDNEGDINKDNNDLESISKIQNGVAIYEDFSLKEPKGFKLEDNLVTVDDWNDLLVKTAEVLTKKYKENKYSKKKVKTDIKVVLKKSPQNDFRDTVIEMLNEYKINLSNFEIIIK